VLANSEADVSWLTEEICTNVEGLTDLKTPNYLLLNGRVKLRKDNGAFNFAKCIDEETNYGCLY
jgi:hypothetical protein